VRPGARREKGAAVDYKEEMKRERRVAVTGLGAVTAFGAGVGTLRAAAWSGASAIAPVTRFDASRFVAKTAAEVRDVPADPEKETEDRAACLALAAAAEALAGLEGPALGGAHTGISMGTTLAGNDAWGRGLAAGTPHLSRSSPGALSALLARRCGARGPVATVSTACASGSAAIGLGAAWIREGRAARVLAGGADALSPFVFSGFDALRALSPSAARPFDEARDGLTLGEGAAFLLLEDEDAARRRGARVLAFVSGYGSAADAFHMTRPRPDGGGVVRAAGAALHQAGRSAADLGFVSAHGTGTVFNDAMEEAALAHVLGSRAGSVPVHGLKGAVGHTLGAAGALEAVLCVLVLGADDVPPTAGHRRSREGSPLFVVSGAPYRPERRVLAALSTSAAFSGTDAALVLERA
jgi:3-oxoacyl-[acyl-carrier-protein] synthase II